MERIDKIYTQFPLYRSRRIGYTLGKSLGEQPAGEQPGEVVNRKRIQRLLRIMGIEAIYPKPRRPTTSDRDAEQKVYPYLLRDYKISRANEVWSTDITDIPMRQGFMYLVAIIDWYSRYVIAHRLSNTMDVSFCVEALEEALSSGQPEIFNSDQGSQFTSAAFTGRLAAADIRISMDGRGRCYDNIFIERLWRSLKYEEVYLKDYADVASLRHGIAEYFRFYNTERPHQARNNQTPTAVHLSTIH